MKVQDNLENYNIPSKFRLSIEQEEELARIVAEIIPELAKRRTSKVQTRKYFKQHLCYSTNVRYDNAVKGKPLDYYEEGESYTPLEGEYAWDSDLLQPVLLDVLSVERYKYGYIVNLLENDILSRGTLQYRNAWTVPDNLVQFCNEFDIDAIREEVAKIEDIRKRIVYLQTKKADLQVTDLLSISEKQDWGPEFDDKIDALIALEEKRLELYPSGYERATPVQVTIPERSPSPSKYSEVTKYCDEDQDTENEAYHLLIKAINYEKPTIEKSMIDELFSFVDTQFDRFLTTCDILLLDKNAEIFTFVDIWFEHFKEAIDEANTRCQGSIKLSVQKKTTELKREDLNKMALAYSQFIIEKAIIVVSGLKANILYNHRYEVEVYYNIYEDPLKEYLAERERLKGKFGAGRDRDIYFDMNTNIEAFYDIILDIVRNGLIEASITSGSIDDDETLPVYKEKVKSLVEQGLAFYVDYMKICKGLNSEGYHEASSWIETTQYCLFSVIMQAALWVACDEKRITFVDYQTFQLFNIEFLPDLFLENLLRQKSDTGDDAIDEKLNDLGERDADEWDYAVPVFDPEVLTDTFITKTDIDDAIRNDPSKVFSAANILSGEEAEAYLKQMESDEEEEAPSTPQDDMALILLSDRKEDVIKYIKDHLDKKTKTNSVGLLIAAKELGITGKLTYAAAVRLFGKFSARSTFNTYYNNKRALDSDTIATYKTALTKEFLTPKTGNS